MAEQGSGSFVSVDQSLCMGSGYCVQEHRELFTLADDGVAELLAGHPPQPAGEGPIELRPDQAEAARAAAETCPAAAISLRAAQG